MTAILSVIDMWAEKGSTTTILRIVLLADYLWTFTRIVSWLKNVMRASCGDILMGKNSSLM